ncbi:MAG: polyprenyl synthetase family protein [Alistipes senegalensis]|nr:polyprenyl synthetase family protein [Oxalobacter formigenes]MCM1280496.1 polyprenyl synthetase family protein [Alistipes senegalensis]
MSQPALPEPVANPFDALPAAVREDMAVLDGLIREQLCSDAALIGQVGEHIINAGGKRIRPLLVMLTARALGYSGQRHHILAAVVELIHTASLLHDDVVDESALRRGVPSANARFGNAASVLVGDFMHTRAFRMMLSAGDWQVMEILAETTNTIAEGEVMQLMQAGCAGVDEAAYFRIIYAKTARLFETAALLGAVAALAPEPLRRAAASCGRALGLAFQLADDALDYAGEAVSLGKETGNDLREGKMTLPLIYLARHGTDTQKKQVREYIGEGEKAHFGAIMRAVRESGSLAYTALQAESEAKKAQEALKAFPGSPCRDCLEALCRFAAGRQY